VATAIVGAEDTAVDPGTMPMDRCCDLFRVTRIILKNDNIRACLEGNDGHGYKRTGFGHHDRLRNA
jgi:hypothetical protein